MDEIGRRENGRQRPDQYKSLHAQWMMPQRQIKEQHTASLIALMTERDNAIQERNQALAEKKAAITERDMAIMQRDAAIAEQNNAIMERDKAITALKLARANRMDSSCGHGCPHGPKNIHYQDLLSHVQASPLPQTTDASYRHTREMHITEAYPISTAPESVEKEVKANKRLRKENKAQADPLKGQGSSGGDPKNSISVTKSEQKARDIGLNQVAFDESTMPPPVCSCTGKLRRCYRLGKGGWRSSCCTAKLSMYPLPVISNKRHARMRGRKMSGTVFIKLLSRLAAEGHDLSMPVDLKDHWAKHGVNSCVTMK